MAATISDVEQFAACLPGDDELVPPWLARTPDLTRSVLDVGGYTEGRPLPLLADLLQAAHDASDAEWLIYTNVDIAPQPYFYEAVARLLAEGNDALVINRRTVPAAAPSGEVPPLELLYAEIGNRHLGYDCFVFPRAWVPELALGTICVGESLVGAALVVALWAKAERPVLVGDAHLTFHLGNDGRWMHADSSPTRTHNARAWAPLLADLQAADPALFDRLPTMARNAALKVSGTGSAMHRFRESSWSLPFRVAVRTVRGGWHEARRAVRGVR